MSGGEKTFTLAPWSICWTVENGERTGGHIVGDDGKGSTAPICNVHFFPRVRDPGETQANLHLMAAAPDLLKACRLADWVFGSWAGAEDHPEEREAIAMLRAAIAKADGRQREAAQCS
jgi:hypothetical protein